MQLLRGRRSDISSLAISPDSRFVAVGGYLECHAWDLHEPKLRARSLYVDKNPSTKLRFTSATELFVCVVNKSWYRYDLDAGATLQLSLSDRVREYGGIVCPNGTRFKTVTQSADVTDFRIAETGFVTLGAAVRVEGIKSLIKFDPTGLRYLALASVADKSGCEYHMYDAGTNALINTLEMDLSESTFRDFAFSPDGHRVYVATRLHLYAFDRLASSTPVVKCVSRVRRAHGVRDVLAVHPDGHVLASLEDEQSVTFRDTESLQVIRTYDFNMPSLMCVAFTPDGTRCVVTAARGKVLLFDVD